LIVTQQELYLIILFDILLIIGFFVGYFVPGARKIPKKGKKLENEEIEKLKGKMDVDAEVYVLPAKNGGINAFQIGAKGKYIVILQPLFEKLNNEQLLAVVAHELAHIKLRHVLKTLLVFNIIFAIGINAFLLPIPNIAIGIISAIAFPLAITLNILLKRKFDYDADRYAAKFVGNEAMISALKGIESAIYPQFLIEKGKGNAIIKRRIEKLQKFKS